MLTDDQILPVCFHWAKRLCTKDVSFDELVDEAYTYAKTLRSPLLLQQWVKWKMLKLVREYHAPVALRDEYDVEDMSFNFKEFTNMQEELLKVIDKTCNDNDKELLYMIFWLSMPYRDIAKVMNIATQTVSFRFLKILKALRGEYERRTR